MDFEHAYNYWRKTFVESSGGHFTKDDFDKWFRQSTDALGYFGIVDNPGSKEHFDLQNRLAFIAMLKACEEGRFK